jgi:hypothetical protein
MSPGDTASWKKPEVENLVSDSLYLVIFWIERAQLGLINTDLFDCSVNDIYCSIAFDEWNIAAASNCSVCFDKEDPMEN